MSDTPCISRSKLDWMGSIVLWLDCQGMDTPYWNVLSTETTWSIIQTRIVDAEFHHRSSYGSSLSPSESNETWNIMEPMGPSPLNTSERKQH
jgi:hypothetical protein